MDTPTSHGPTSTRFASYRVTSGFLLALAGLALYFLADHVVRRGHGRIGTLHSGWLVCAAVVAAVVGLRLRVRWAGLVLALTLLALVLTIAAT